MRDENGNELEPTWPKRARGLVKSGRARFVSDDTIILTSSEDAKRTLPPEMEDIKMPETAYNDTETAVTVIGDAPRAEGEDIGSTGPSLPQITVREILDRIDALVRDQSGLRDALDRIQLIGSGGGDQPGSPGDIAGQAKAQGIADMLRARETTIQKTLDFYMQVYRDLQPNDELNHRTADLGMINEAVIQLASIDTETVGVYLDGLRHLSITV